ncbi:VWA domain-containing protein [Acidicapsa acidisoli]|uniref:VWA domain-containing protein n=1 Tax=Acidicapsa acidisoli TaxID=1615681 RepID=UPI0021E0B558|nr:VWA domain-containing protein [Acidicapsa acidisoli]
MALAIAGSFPSAVAQATSEAQKGTNRQIDLDVMVTDADGKAVPNLTAQDFTVLDNGKMTAIQAFRESRSRETDAATAGDTEVVVLFDTVNSSLPDVAYARDQVGKFLRQDGGKLAYPVELLAFNGNGVERIAEPSRDGNALAAALEKAGSNLHPIRRSEAFWGAVERLQLSLGTLGNLAQAEARVPGRKLVFWISPGWPLLVGTQNYPSSRELQTFFNAIVAMSNGLREARIVLYSLDPVRTPGADMLRWNYYRGYLKGVPDARRAMAADLALQVLATQSGGNVINFSDKDMWQEIANRVAKAEDFYSLAVAAPSETHADEYHSLKITLDKPGLTVQTRSGYYGEP